MKVADLKTAAEVREHARKVQKRIDEQKRRGRIEPDPIPKDVRVHESVTAPAELRQKTDVIRSKKRRQPPRKSLLSQERLETLHYAVINQIIDIVAVHTNTTSEQILFPSKDRRFFLPRYVGYFIAYQFGFSVKNIRRANGCRNGKAVTYGINHIREKIEQCNLDLIDKINLIGEEAASKLFDVKWHPIVPPNIVREPDNEY